jgi:2,3-bisphosphoglycerate-independent phosphoglycerate mutase
VVDVLLILDGASEPVGPGATSLERARTPSLDRVASAGRLSRLRTVAPWLPAGSEAAIPALLGWTPTAPVDRGALEAAAYDVAVAVGERAWRVDVLVDGERADAAATRRAAEALRTAAPAHAVHRLAGHRLLVTGPGPLPAPARAAGLRVWPAGAVPPHRLDAGTVLVGARGAAVGTARLMGATTVVPPGATGQPDSDLAAKAASALAAIAAGSARVVVHVGGPDEASHRRDRAAKIAAIEQADLALVGPLMAAVGRAGGRLRVCPDHGCDPRTGEHDAAPVPCVDWFAGAGPRRVVGPRLTERAVAALPAEPVDATCREAA